MKVTGPLRSPACSFLGSLSLNIMPSALWWKQRAYYLNIWNFTQVYFNVLNVCLMIVYMFDMRIYTTKNNQISLEWKTRDLFVIKGIKMQLKQLAYKEKIIFTSKKSTTKVIFFQKSIWTQYIIRISDYERSHVKVENTPCASFQLWFVVIISMH